MITIQYGNQKRVVSTGLRVKPKHWNKKKNEVRQSHPEADRINAILSNIVRDAEKTFLRLKDQGRRINADMLKMHVGDSAPGNSFWAYCDEWLKSQEKKGRVYYKRRCSSIVRKFRSFVGGPLGWEELTPELMARFQEHMETLPRPNNPNTIRGAFRVLKSIVNSAIRTRVIGPSASPFFVFRYTGRSPVQKVALTRDEISRLEALELEQGSWECSSRDMYLLAYRSRGMRFLDIASLKWENVVDDRLEYVTSKNGKFKSVPIKTEVREILSRYGPQDPGVYIFPFFRGKKMDTPQQRMKVNSSANALCNRYLKIVAELAGIKKRLHSHSNRHSLATNALSAGVGTAAIQKALGHASLSQTERYLAELGQEEEDAAFDAADL